MGGGGASEIIHLSRKMCLKAALETKIGPKPQSSATLTLDLLQCWKALLEGFNLSNSEGDTVGVRGVAAVDIIGFFDFSGAREGRPSGKDGRHNDTRENALKANSEQLLTLEETYRVPTTSGLGTGF